MKQEAFERAYSDNWQAFENSLELLETGSDDASSLAEQNSLGRRFPAQYRQICHHLSLARARRYSIGLQQRLNRMALDGHQHLYRARIPVFTSILRFLVAGFPRAFREHWKYMTASALLFYAPMAAMAVAVNMQPDLIYSLLEPMQVSMMEEMYNPENDVLGRERESETDMVMFGHYIYNNITIGFRTFAGGLLFGLGSIFFLSFNGLYFGAVATHLTRAGFTITFWPFVSGHSALELTAIVIFGGAGLLIGMGALAPGRKSRWHAIRDRARDSLPLVYGGALMLVGAAFVEAFWSSTTWPPVSFKYWVGGFFWLATCVYFTVMGRNEP